MAASNTNPSLLGLVIPTPAPQRYINADGSTISGLITDEDEPGPFDELDPNVISVAQTQSSAGQLALPDGSVPNMDAAVLTPYSLVTPPGAIVVG